MPLRKLPTEQQAADALLRLEALRQRHQDRKSVWQPRILMACAAGLLVAVLLPGPGTNSCYLWRASSDPTIGRLIAGLLPLMILTAVLLDTMLPERSMQRLRLRGWAAIVIGTLTVLAWAGLVTQGRTGCGTSPAIIGTVTLGLVATVTAIIWARHRERLPPLLTETSESDEDPEPLNQAELHAAFVYLQKVLSALKESHVLRLAPLAATASGLLLLTTVLPWRELVDPMATGSAGAEAGLPRFQLWEMTYTGGWPLVLAATASATIAAAIATVSSPLIRRAQHGILMAGATATGVAILAGLFTAVLRLPPRLPDGVGYRPGVGAWIALALGAALTALGLASLVQAVRRSSRGWQFQAVAVGLAAVMAAAAGVLVPAATGPAFEPEARDGIPHRLLDLRGGLFSDTMGLRVSLGTSSALTSIAWSLDGEPGLWLMGRTGSDNSTVYAVRDGLALPRTTLSHGYSPPTLVGISGGRMLLLTGPTENNQRWALLAVPLELPFADLSLQHQNADGSYYVTPGVERLAQGNGTIRLQRSADGTVVMWGPDGTWRVPLAALRPGLVLNRYSLDLGPGSRNTRLASAPDGTAAWWTGNHGLAVQRPGSPVEQLTGTAPEGCPLSADLAGSSIGAPAFAVDAAGNIWIAGDKTIPAAVLTTDGVLRVVPNVVDRVEDLEARPDGSVLLGSRSARGNQILEITRAAQAANRYKPAPPPSKRCAGPHAPATGTTYSGSPVRDIPTVLAPVDILGKPGRARELALRGLLALDASGKLVRMRYPQNAVGVSPDGQGGLWWGAAQRSETASPRGFTAVHLPPRSRTALTIKDPVPASAGRQDAPAAAYGDRFVAPMGEDRYGFYGPSNQAKQVPVTSSENRPSKPVIGLTSSGAAGIVLQGRLISLTTDGRQIELFGGPGLEQWAIWSAIENRIAPQRWSAAGSWFGGPDGRLWGYDGSHLYRVEGIGRVTVLAGPGDGLPQAADRVTKIGTDLYFEFGDDVLRVTPKAAR